MKSFRWMHLIMGLAAITAYLVAEEYGLVHAWAGYIVGATLLLRLGFGLAGRPGFGFARLKPLTAGSGKDRIGRVLTLALLVALFGVAGTGIAMDQGGTLIGQSIRANEDEKREAGESDGGERENDMAIMSTAVNAIIPPARADDGAQESGESEESLLGEVHETLGSLILPLAIAHLLYMLAFRLPMARFMIFAEPRRTKRI